MSQGINLDELEVAQKFVADVVMYREEELLQGFLRANAYLKRKSGGTARRLRRRMRRGASTSRPPFRGNASA